MALSFSEKRGLQKEVQTCLAALGETPDFKAKRSLQKHTIKEEHFLAVQSDSLNNKASSENGSAPPAAKPMHSSSSHQILQ